MASGPADANAFKRWAAGAGSSTLLFHSQERDGCDDGNDGGRNGSWRATAIGAQRQLAYKMLTTAPPAASCGSIVMPKRASSWFATIIITPRAAWGGGVRNAEDDGQEIDAAPARWLPCDRMSSRPCVRQHEERAVVVDWSISADLFVDARRAMPVRHDDEASEVSAGRIPWKQPRLCERKRNHNYCRAKTNRIAVVVTYALQPLPPNLT
jgi:hypothetical protein